MIRKARGEDASRIAEILVFVKRLNYRSIFHNDAVSFGELQVYPLAKSYIEKPETLASVWVYDDGFVKAMMRAEGEELIELYVDAFFQNEGIGARLVKFACRVLRCRRLWVLEKNTRAIAFYRRHGFSLAGERRTEEGTAEYIVLMSLPERGFEQGRENQAEHSLGFTTYISYDTINKITQHGGNMSERPVFDAILARRSIRHFQDRPVPKEHIELLLRAAMAAPSACNLQPWVFIVINEPSDMAALRKTAEQGDYNAALAIVVCGTSKHIPWDGEGWRQDCGGAAQNIMLECVELGLASVCIGGFDEKALGCLLNLPDEVEPICIIEIGYPAYTRPALSWYSDEAVHYGRFDSQKPRKYRTLSDLEADIAAGII